MNSFLRAVREALKYWPAVVASIGCSVAVAVLWGANIAALFPIIEATLQGKSLQDWNREQITQSKQELTAHEAELKSLAARIEKAPAEERAELDIQLQMLEVRKQAKAAELYSAERVQPFFESWLPSTPFATIALIASLVLVATLMKQVFMVTNAVLVSSVSQSVSRDLRGRLFNSAITLDRPGFDAHGTSGFAAHITYTTDMLSVGLTNILGGAVTEPLRIFACLAGAWMISWRLTLASLIFAPLAAYLIVFLNRSIRRLSLRILDRSRGFHHVMLEVFGSLTTVKANTMEDFERERFRESTELMKRTAMTATFYNSLTSPVTELFGIGMLCTGIVVSGYLVTNQRTDIFGIPMSDRPLSVSLLTVFFAMLIGAADPLRKLSGVVTGVNNGMAAANLLFPIIDAQSRIREPESPRAFPSPHQEIEFRHVHFSYDGVQPVLQDVNLRIERGEHVALVGANGSGKSTIVSLLCRFYEPQSGDIEIDGVPIREMALADLRKRIAVVSQQTELFNETVLHNIRYGRWDATEEEVIEAAKLARADEFVSNLPQGYHTIVGANGQRLSGGQRQRIALARAILRDAEILILDEATSQIDVESERLIHDALQDIAVDRTLIMVTHRESTLALAQRVIHVENGRLLELDSATAMSA
ncbi:ABC transporter ATP-binding protein [Aeoliella sp. SH292]|uniref:ABC transporter ATP-binding protein n=1 Tax=Aeoliella sp. SH292 TaxID=3454464 RepID=UPI003F9AB248